MRDIKVMNDGKMVAKVNSIPMALLLVDAMHGQVVTVNGRRVWNTAKDMPTTRELRFRIIAERLNGFQAEAQAKMSQFFPVR